jgi:RNA polymerase sigma factor (sigma-70 family)
VAALTSQKTRSPTESSVGPKRSSNFNGRYRRLATTRQKSASPFRSGGDNACVVDVDLSQTRHTLLQRLKECGDDASWQDFFNTYWRLIYTTAIRAHLTPEEAQDVVQETVVSVTRNIKQFRVGSQHGSFKAWLLKMTRWRIADQFRKRPHLPNGSFAVDDTNATPIVEGIPDPLSLEPDAKWEADWQQNLMDAAIERVKARVDPLDYQMFDLHVLKLWPAARVAKLLNVKIGNVYFAKYNILRQIKREVQRIETKFV